MNAPRAAHSARLISLIAVILSQALPPARAAADDGTWAGPLAGPAPPIRYAHAAIYDPVRNRMVVFGGQGASGLLNDVWALSLSGTPTWTEITPSKKGPSARFHATAIYDPVRDRMLVFGGWDRGPTNDVWALSLSGIPSWSHLVVVGSPEPRFQHTAIYDPVRDRMVVAGGTIGGNYYEEDVWELTLAGTPTWHVLPPAPTTHWLHTAIYDPVRDRMVVFGGYSSGADPALAYETDQTWEMSFVGDGVWTQLSPAPDPITGTVADHRGGHVAIYDPTGDRMLVFGGSHHYDYYLLNDVWALSLGENPAWRQLLPTGRLPDVRYVCSAIARDGDQMVVFGGSTADYVRNDTWTLSLAQPVSAPLGVDTPARFELARPRPNPSRGATLLGFDLARPERVVLDVFDAHGHRVTRVADALMPAGHHTVTWRGDDSRGRVVDSGVYYVQMQAGAFRATRRAVQLR